MQVFFNNGEWRERWRWQEGRWLQIEEWGFPVLLPVLLFNVVCIYAAAYIKIHIIEPA